MTHITGSGLGLGRGYRVSSEPTRGMGGDVWPSYLPTIRQTTSSTSSQTSTEQTGCPSSSIFVHLHSSRTSTILQEDAKPTYIAYLGTRRLVSFSLRIPHFLRPSCPGISAPPRPLESSQQECSQPSLQVRFSPTPVCEYCSIPPTAAKVATKLFRVDDEERRSLLMQHSVGVALGYPPGLGANRATELSVGDLNLGSGADPEKGYISYSTFPDFEPTQPLERGPLNMARVTAIVFVCLTLLLTYTAALPLDLWSVLTGRQLSTPPPSSFSNNHVPQNITKYDAKNWVLSTTSFIPNHYQTQPYVANGYHGSRVPAEGIGFWVCSPGLRVLSRIRIRNTNSPLP